MCKNGVSKKIIKERIYNDNIRIDYDALKIEKYWLKNDRMLLYLMASMARQLYKDKWLEIYNNIMYNIISNSASEFLLYSMYNYESGCDGIFIVYVDISVFVQNIMEDYHTSLIQWRDIDELREYPKLVSKANMLYKQIKNNYRKSFGVLIAFNDDINNKLYLSTQILKIESGKKLATNISLIRSICECDNIMVPEGEKIHTEKEWITQLIDEEINAAEPTIFDKTYNYKYFSDFVNENAIFKDKDLKHIQIDIIYLENMHLSYKVSRDATFKIIYKNNNTKKIESLKQISLKIDKLCKDNNYNNYSVTITEETNNDILIRKQFVITLETQFIIANKIKHFYLNELQSVDKDGKKILGDINILTL